MTTGTMKGAEVDFSKSVYILDVSFEVQTRHPVCDTFSQCNHLL